MHGTEWLKLVPALVAASCRLSLPEPRPWLTPTPTNTTRLWFKLAEVFVCRLRHTNRQRTPFVHVGAPVHTELTNLPKGLKISDTGDLPALKDQGLRRAVLHRSRKWTEPTRADIEVDADLLGLRRACRHARRCLKRMKNDAQKKLHQFTWLGPGHWAFC